MKNKRGITLVALVVTILVLLILAGITINAIFGDNGIINNAKQAKINEEIASEQEAIGQAAAAITKQRYGIGEESFQDALDNQLGEGKAIVYEEENGYIVEFTETNRYYEVDDKGKPGDPITLEPVNNAGDITKGGTCTGTQDKPYRIECIEDLVDFSKRINAGNWYSNKYIILTKDLDFKSISSYSDFRTKYKYDDTTNSYVTDPESETTIKELCTTGQGFIPIADTGKRFDGNFDGQNHVIKNIHVNREDNASLFGNSTGIISNLTITGHIVSTNATAAGFISSGNTKFTKCCNKATIEGKTNAAGISAGGGGAKITRCCNEGEIICHGGTTAVGIIVGTATLNKCYNSGKITNEGGTTRSAIGICGGSFGDWSIINCYNTGEITSLTGAAGGLLSWFGKTVSNCYNTGPISGVATWNYNSGVARYYSFWCGLYSNGRKLLLIRTA